MGPVSDIYDRGAAASSIFLATSRRLDCFGQRTLRARSVLRSRTDCATFRVDRVADLDSGMKAAPRTATAGRVMSILTGLVRRVVRPLTNGTSRHEPKSGENDAFHCHGHDDEGLRNW